jgi:hypothetical protein
MEKIVTNNGKKGGWLHGKPHYRKDGKSAGGIKAVVTDAGNKPVELEGGEVIINKEASKKHWKELSRINQSAGGGVPIAPPDGADEDPSEYKSGGNVIEFNANHIPSKWILSYAEKIKTKYPEIWKLGGNIFGNEAYVNLKRVAERGYWLDSEEWMYIKWRAYVARHHKDFRIEGVIAMLKWVDKVDKGWAYMKNLIEERIDKIESKKDKKGWKHKMKKGGDVSEVDIEKRWDKKRNGIKTLSNNIQSLRYNLTKDLQSEDEKVFLTALAISLMDSSGERVGNEESANNGHFGITGFEKKHIKIDGDKITLSYIGKSGVTHNKSFTDKKLSEGLKKAIKNSNSSLVFCTSDGFNIKADKINRYLQDYDISAKDLRGYLANKLVVYKLDANIKDEKERKKKFNEILKSVADSVGHGRATLKTHYLLPEIETLYVEKGKVFDIKNYGSGGNLSKTLAPKSERIYGSKTNKSGSAESKESAKSIKFDESLITTIKDKIKGTGISLDTAKAVVRRGMGAYSSTHRPTITGGKPNSRTAWGLARLNAFLYKTEHGKSKSGKYFQDDDLMKYGGEIKDITCKSCNWSWNKSDSEKYDEYVCHKCGTDNKMKYGGELENINWKELSNKENKKYYTELAKMENKFAEGGLILPGKIVVNVGDRVVIKGRNERVLLIASISNKSITFDQTNTPDAEKLKIPSLPIDKFKKQFVRIESSAKKFTQSKQPDVIESQKDKVLEKETKADFNARKNMYFKEGDYFYFGNDTSEWYKITEYNKNVVNPTFGTITVKYIDENGKELVVPEDDFKNTFDLKNITLIYNPPIKKPSYQVGDYFKSDTWTNNDWARIDKIDKDKLAYTLEKDGKNSVNLKDVNRLFESTTWYLIPGPTKPKLTFQQMLDKAVGMEVYYDNNFFKGVLDKYEINGKKITFIVRSSPSKPNTDLLKVFYTDEARLEKLLNGEDDDGYTLRKKRRTYTDSYIAYCDEVYRLLFSATEDYAKTLLTKDGYNDFFDRVVGVGFSDQWDAYDTATVLFQLKGCEAKDEWNEGELVYWISGKKEKVITKKDYNPDKSVYYELDGELGWFSAQSFVTAPSNLLKKEPKKSKQPAPAIVKKNEIAKNSEQSLRMWMGTNMVKHTKLNTTLLAKKSLSDFADNLKLLDDKNEVRFDDGGLISPNGKPSNLTPEQYKLVRTPAFKKWFGDWESAREEAISNSDKNDYTSMLPYTYKGVNNKFYKGVSKVMMKEPMIVWHGSSEEFNIFDNKKGLPSFYFSSKKEVSKLYGSIVKPYYLNIKNPIVFYADCSEYQGLDNMVHRLMNSLISSKKGNKEVIVYNYGAEYVIKPENDGIIIVNIVDANIEDMLDDYGNDDVNIIKYDKLRDKYCSDVFIAYSPKQIKLADGSNTTFDDSNPDIRFKDGGNTEQYKTIAFFTNKKFKIFDGKKSFTDIKKQFGITPLRLEVIKVKTKDLTNNNLFIKWSKNELKNKYNEILDLPNLYFSIIKEGENNIVKNAFWENELTGKKYEYDAENITWVKK